MVFRMVCILGGYQGVAMQFLGCFKPFYCVCFSKQFLCYECLFVCFLVVESLECFRCSPFINGINIFFFPLTVRVGCFEISVILGYVR